MLGNRANSHFKETFSTFDLTPQEFDTKNSLHSAQKLKDFLSKQHELFQAFEKVLSLESLQAVHNALEITACDELRELALYFSDESIITWKKQFCIVKPDTEELAFLNHETQQLIHNDCHSKFTEEYFAGALAYTTLVKDFGDHSYVFNVSSEDINLRDEVVIQLYLSDKAFMKKKMGEWAQRTYDACQSFPQDYLTFSRNYIQIRILICQMQQYYFFGYRDHDLKLSDETITSFCTGVEKLAHGVNFTEEQIQAQLKAFIEIQHATLTTSQAQQFAQVLVTLARSFDTEIVDIPETCDRVEDRMECYNNCRKLISREITLMQSLQFGEYGSAISNMEFWRKRRAVPVQEKVSQEDHQQTIRKTI